MPSYQFVYYMSLVCSLILLLPSIIAINIEEEDRQQQQESELQQLPETSGRLFLAKRMRAFYHPYWNPTLDPVPFIMDDYYYPPSPPRRTRPNNVFRRRRIGGGGHGGRAPRHNGVRFYLYPDPVVPHYHEEIVVGNNASLSSYKPYDYPIILIQDYMQNHSTPYPERTKDAYLKLRYPANIIIVDWRRIATPKFGLMNNLATRYPKISRKVSRISRQITDLLLFLSETGRLREPEKAHIIGFGLGAQIAGVTGNNFKRASGQMLGRISGLDPSGLQYHYTALSEKLDKSDAFLVDVYHTTSAPFGFGSSIGTVDFYPNGGGPSQPGCKLPMLDMMKDIPGMEGSCAHNRAWEYFTDSIYNNKIYACQSTSYLIYKMKSSCLKPVVFGQHVSPTASGDYFLELMHKDYYTS